MKKYRKIFSLTGIIVSLLIALIQGLLYVGCGTGWFCGLYFAYPLAVFVPPLFTGIPGSIPIIIVAQTIVVTVILYLIGWLFDSRGGRAV